MNKIKSLLILSILFISSSGFSQAEGDRIIAIIGNDIITESDFQYQVQLYARQNQLEEISPYLAQQIFQSIITNKMILAKAEQDSIIVTEDEVTRELDSRLKGLIEQVGSQERLEQAYGMSLAKIKTLLKKDLQDNLMIEKLKRKQFQGGMRINDKELQDFYETYKDSLPDVSQEFELAHIFLERKVSDAEKTEAKRIAALILDSIKAGEDFSELAKRNSSDSSSAIAGGDLGYAKKGTFVKEFEETVFSMNPGEVSEIVETEFGYHIIKLNEKQGDKVKSQHILISFPKFESSDFETINFLKALKQRIEKGEITFDTAAIQYSQDEATKSKGGYLGKISVEQLDSMTVESLQNLSAGQISDPLRIGTDQKYGYEIYKLIKSYPPHKLSMEDDYEKIKRFAVSYKENKEMEKWINEIRETIYVDIKL
ncbi:MAG: peptidylprolyl isomerase [Bacteroidota bacterium]|nr:peptidylprolyl isomerase [Bacteroidota bacterium]